MNPVMRTAALCLTWLSLVSSGCEDDSDDPSSPLDGGTTLLDASLGDGAAPSDSAAPGPTVRRFAIATQVFGANDQTSYLRLHEGDLFQGVASSGGVERVGRALAVAGLEPGTVYYVSDKLATIDRYVAQAGAFTPGPKLNLSGEGVMGVSEYAGQLVVVSVTKAIYFDARTLKAIVWNPQTMTLVKSIDLSQVTVPSFSAAFSTATTTRDGKVYMPVGYRTPVAVPSVTAVVVVDTNTDTAKVVKDERCGYVRDGVEGSDGKLYLATEAFASAVHYLSTTAAPAPCLLRFDYATDSFDGTFKVDLNALAGGKTVGSLVRLPNGKVYTRVLDPSKVPAMAMPSGRGIASAEAWGWSEITLTQTPTLTPVADGYVSGGSIIPFDLNGLFVYPAFSADLAKTTLCDMSNGPQCPRKVEVPGLVFSVALLR